MNLAALKSLSLGKLLTTAHKETIRRRRETAATIQHNRQAAERRRRNRIRKQESDAANHQALLDTAYHLHIPPSRLGLHLLTHFTPLMLKNRRLIWLELRNLYAPSTFNMHH